MMYRKTAFTITMLLALVLMACTPQLGPILPQPPTATSEVTPTDEPPQDLLANTSWTLLSFGGEGSEQAMSPDAQITLIFDGEGGVAGTGGCNSYGGTYQAGGGSLTFGELVQTEMACLDGDIMEQESQFFAALNSATQYELVADQLVLSSGEGQDTLTFTAGVADNGGEPVDGALTGTSWILENFERDGSEALAPAGKITLEFGEDGNLGGSAGCNSYGGPYTVEGSTLTIGELFSTLMACADQEVMDQEAEYLDMLRGVSQFELNGEELVLSGETVTLTFLGVEVEAPSSGALTGVTWLLDTFGVGETVSSVVAGSEVTLVFDEEGRASGNGGCNQYSSDYQAADGALSFSPVVSTRMYCDGVMEQEQAYFRALEAAEAYELDGDRLTITAAGGESTLGFVRGE